MRKTTYAGVCGSGDVLEHWKRAKCGRRCGRGVKAWRWQRSRRKQVIFPLQPFSQKSRTATVPKVFQIGLCGVVEADLELFWDSWSVGFLGERLYVQKGTAMEALTPSVNKLFVLVFNALASNDHDENSSTLLSEPRAPNVFRQS